MRFFKCADCSSVLILDNAQECCTNGWTELLANTTDASGEKHVPVIETEGSIVTVTVGSVEHPMLDAHYIMWILIETSQGYQKKNLSPGEESVARFSLAEGEQLAAAYEYCNLHGLWKAEG